MKKAFAILLFAALAQGGLLFANGSKESATGATVRVGLVLSTLNNPFFVSLRDGAVQEAKADGIDLVVLDSQNDAAKEMSNVEDLISQNVQAVMINPTDSDAVGAAVKLLNRSHIPVVTLDRSANSGDVVSHIASDNVAGGKMAGDYIVKLLKGSGNVVELQGLAGTSAARDRGQGFTNALQGTKIKIVAQQAADFDRTKGLNVMENILQAQPSIDAVFADNDEMALGAVKAIQGSGRHILVVGFDATDDARAAVKAGTMAATVAQQPTMIGSLGVQTVKAILAGQTVPKFTPVPLSLITK